MGYAILWILDPDRHKVLSGRTQIPGWEQAGSGLEFRSGDPNCDTSRIHAMLKSDKIRPGV